MTLARAAFVFAAALSCAAGERVPTELFPPNTRMVIGLSLRALFDSQLLNAAGGTASLPSLPFGAIDPKELDSVIIATEGGTSDAPSIAVVRGRFRLDPSKAVRHGGIPIFQDRKGALALLDDGTALGGSLADVKSAIDRRGAAPAISSDLAARIDAVSEGNDFWAVGDIPEGLQPKGASAKGLDAVDRFDFGAALRNGLQVRGSIRLRSADEAAQLAAAIRMFGAMFRPDPNKTAAKFDLRAEGRTISIDLSIPEAELKQTIASQRGVLTGMLQGGMPAALARPGSAPIPMAAPAGAPAASPRPAPIPRSFTPSEPATVVTNDRGETVTVTLPGAKF